MTANPLSLTLRALALAALAAATLAPAAAQQPFPSYPNAAPSGRNPVCLRLEAQLASVDRGNFDPARADQVRRYEEAAGRQQAELDRLNAQARRQGCEGRGFFSLFGGQPQQCGPLNAQIQQMRGNLDRILADLQRMQADSPAREGQRRQLLVALAQNDCGPQYRSAALPQRDFFDSLFGTRHLAQPDRADLGHLPHPVRAHLRRILFPDLLFDGAGQVRRGRARLSAHVPGGGSGALQPPQSR